MSNESSLIELAVGISTSEWPDCRCQMTALLHWLLASVPQNDQTVDVKWQLYCTGCWHQYLRMTRLSMSNDSFIALAVGISTSEWPDCRCQMTALLHWLLASVPQNDQTVDVKSKLDCSGCWYQYLRMTKLSMSNENLIALAVGISTSEWPNKTVALLSWAVDWAISQR